MKNLKVFLVAILSVILFNAQANNGIDSKRSIDQIASSTAVFSHPGLFSSQAELDRIKSIINGTASHPMKDGYNVMVGTNLAKLTYNATPYDTVHVIGSGSNAEEKAIRDNALAVYAHALQWVVTGDKQYSQKAIQIMNAWSAKIKDIVPTSDSPGVQDELESDWYCPLWLAGAEIILHYNNGAAGWSAADVSKFNTNMVGLFKTKALAWKGSQGCCPNQALSVVFARMSLGVYLDDKVMFDDAVKYYTSSVLARAVADNGEILELNRAAGGDCGHANYNIEAVFDISEIAWHQGVNLYEYKLNGETTPRLVKGIEYMSQVILTGMQTSQVGFVHCTGQKPVGIEMAMNAYMNRFKGYSLPHTQDLLNSIRPVNQGSGKFIPWDTFTHADLDKNTNQNKVPTVSITSPANNSPFTAPASITINASATDADGSITKVEFFNGTSKLGEATVSPYSYVWNNVAIGTYSITAKATDDKGAATTSSTVAVTVTCSPTAITSYIQVDGGTWQKITNVSANSGSTVKFGPQPATSGSWKWSGPNGFSATSREVTISNIQSNQAGNYVVTYINDVGCSSNATIMVTVNTVTTNTPPTVSITSPTNNAIFTEGASITINANASDVDGSVAKVEFFNGTTKIGEDATSPYSLIWSGPIAGNYSLTAKATDNKGAMTTSAAVSVIVNVSTNPCTGTPTYVENSGYIAGSKVQNAGGMYQCKPYPYTGWCNGAAWAYAPGTGTYWADAWDKIGTCSARIGNESEMNGSIAISVLPNPTSHSAQVKLNEKDIISAEYAIINPLGVEVLKGKLNNNLEGEIDLSGMKSGIYTIRVSSNGNSWMNKIVKQ